MALARLASTTMEVVDRWEFTDQDAVNCREFMTMKAVYHLKDYTTMAAFNRLAM